MSVHFTLLYSFYPTIALSGHQTSCFTIILTSKLYKNSGGGHVERLSRAHKQTLCGRRAIKMYRNEIVCAVLLVIKSS